MAYSNGYNLTTVLPKLFGRLAWTDSNLNTANTTSTSGRKFDDGSFHAVVNSTNVKATASPEPSDFNAWFTAKQNAVISRCLNNVFNAGEHKQQTLIYERSTEQEALIGNTGKAIGYKIQIAKNLDLSHQINTLEMYFDGAATFNVYLFKQGKLTPLQTKSVTTVANEKTVVSLTDWILNARESGVYWVVYFQADLGSVKAIQEQACFHSTRCFGIETFEAETTGSAFDRVSYSSSMQPSGMNMQMTSFRDFTQNILNQPHLFDELIGLTMAYQCIEEMIYTVRSNGEERELKHQLETVGLQLDLNGAAPISDSPRVQGLRQRIDRETDRVRNAFYPKPKTQTVNIC